MQDKTMVVVIGAGQSGIAAAYLLQKYHIPYLVLDQGSYVGQTWAERYDSLTLDSMRTYSHLFRKFPFPGEPYGQPSKDEVVEYLQNIVKQSNIHPIFNTTVTEMTKSTGGGYCIKTNNKTYQASHVIIATGAFYQPYTPDINHSQIPAIHTKEYKNPGQIPGKNVLIVGSGNSGCEITRELLDHGKHVVLSTRNKKARFVKNSSLSQWIAYFLGVAHVPFWHPVGFLALWYTSDKSIGDDARYISQHPNCTLIDKVTTIDNQIHTEDGSQYPLPDYIIFATGFRSQYPWIKVPEINFGPRGSIKHLHGKTGARNVYVLGQRWQYSKSSSHITGVNRDAFVITNWIRGTSWIKRLF